MTIPSRKEIERLLDAVADTHGVTRYDLLSRSRTPKAGVARNEFWWRLFDQLGMTKEEIAATFKRPLRTIQAGIKSRAIAHGETTQPPDHRAQRKALVKMLREGRSYAEISEKLGFSVKSLPTLASRLKAHYSGIRATAERPAVPEPFVTEYRRLLTAEKLTPVEAARRLNLID